jgi:hypothetical protein
MDTHETGRAAAGRGRGSDALAPGPQAAAIQARRIPGVRFAPFRGDDFSLFVGVCA